MKLVFLVFILFQFSPALLGSDFVEKELIATVEEVLCEEVDIFVIGDVCIVFHKLVLDSKKIALVYNSKKFQSIFREKSELIGSTVNLNLNDYENFSRKELSVLKNYNSEYFYLKASIDLVLDETDYPLNSTEELKYIENVARDLRRFFWIRGHEALKSSIYELSKEDLSVFEESLLLHESDDLDAILECLESNICKVYNIKTESEHMGEAYTHLSLVLIDLGKKTHQTYTYSL